MRLSSTDRGAIDKLKNHFSKIQIADKDGDLDRDGYTSAAWDGDMFSNGATGTINWVVDFARRFWQSEEEKELAKRAQVLGM